jgi:hypothetical protein
MVHIEVASSFEVVDFAIVVVAYDNFVAVDDTSVVVQHNYYMPFVAVVVVVAAADSKQDFVCLLLEKVNSRMMASVMMELG